MSENRIIPRHVAFIMDGNGRWAKLRNKPRNFGHQKGAENVEHVVSACFSSGIEYISLYAFSTENWQRPKSEVDKLMRLFVSFLKTYTKSLVKNQIKLIVTGSRQGLSEELILEIEKSEKQTSSYQRTLNLAINYGGKQEIVKAVNDLIISGKTSVTENDVEAVLQTAGVPDVDLLVRTSGEQRISNFFLWKSAYAELYFTDVLWPDFNEVEIQKAIDWYSSRNRRFGKI